MDKNISEMTDDEIEAELEYQYSAAADDAFDYGSGMSSKQNRQRDVYIAELQMELMRRSQQPDPWGEPRDEQPDEFWI